MYGAILGDIIGSPYEFDRGSKTKTFPLFSGSSMFTDDILPWKTNQCAADRRALRDELNSIISDADAVEARLQALEEAEADERIESVPELVPDPAPEPDEPVFSKQDVSFSFKIVEQQDARAYLPAYDFGQCDDKSTVSVVLGDETASAVYLTERAGQIELGFSCRSDGGLRTATVTYRIDETVFGLPGVPEICNWAYRVGSKDSWHLITEDIFSQTGASGLSALSIPETGWQNLIGDSEETIELRCEVYRANTDGGSATFLIEGSLMIFEKWGNARYQYRNRELWCRGYYVDTVGKDTKKIAAYIQNQLREDELGNQLTMENYDPFTGSK